MLLKIVYNSETDYQFFKNLASFLAERSIDYEEYDVRYIKDKKKAFKVKGAFSARIDPFIGIYQDDKPIKGFYSEANECNYDNVIKWINDNGTKFGKIERGL